MILLTSHQGFSSISLKTPIDEFLSHIIDCFDHFNDINDNAKWYNHYESNLSR